MIRTKNSGRNWPFPYILYSPEHMSKNRIALIVQLHGTGEWGNCNEEMGRLDERGFSKILLNNYSTECFVAIPQCPTGGYWPNHMESLLEFIWKLKANFPVDPDRVSLTGMEMGGYGTWFAAMEAPEQFAAIAPVCGGGMSFKADVLTMPIWAFHGTEDDRVPVSQSDEMVAAVKRCGGNIRYTRAEGVGQNIWEQAYSKELLNWLIKQKRP